MTTSSIPQMMVFPLCVLIVSLSVVVGNPTAEAGQRHVETRKGQRPEPSVAVDNVCAWFLFRREGS